MSCIVATIAVDAMGVEPLGVKEALVMAVETLGRAQVLQIDVQEPEQMGIDGAAPPRPAPKPARRQAPARGRQAPPRDPAPPQSGQAQAGTGNGRRVKTTYEVCDTCVRFYETHGRDAKGDFYWGMCVNTGKKVYKLRDRCGVWKGR